MIDGLLAFHRKWGYVAIALNAIAGVVALVAWRWRRYRGRWVWITTIIAEAAILLQVIIGAIVVAAHNDYATEGGAKFKLHMFYGFLVFLTIGLAYQYRRNSHFIGGVGRDAETVARSIVERRAMRARSRTHAVAA